jgi:hypothetical protein
MAKSYYLYKKTSGVKGPFRLTSTNASHNKLSTPGIYLLAEKHSKGHLVLYVGRAKKLNNRLPKWVGKYDHFFYKPTKTEHGAFFDECHHFHKYGKANNLDNKIHPAVPAGTSLPLCSERGCKGEAY